MATASERLMVLRMNEEAAHERRGAKRGQQEFSGAMVAAQARGETAGSRRTDRRLRCTVRAGCRKRVPEHLRNAALRKSWALDPAIRNYVNPALDYAYDWNTRGGVPGSSEIGSGMDVARLVSQIMGGGSTVEPVVPAVSPGNETAGDPAQSLEHDTIHKSGLELPAQAVRLSKETVLVAQKPANAEEGSHIAAEGAEPSELSRSAAPQQVVRRHGSAKPLV
jgi:Protein of unknown function (DUF3306)